MIDRIHLGDESTNDLLREQELTKHYCNRLSYLINSEQAKNLYLMVRNQNEKKERRKQIISKLKSFFKWQ